MQWFPEPSPSLHRAPAKKHERVKAVFSTKASVFFSKKDNKFNRGLHGHYCWESKLLNQAEAQIVEPLMASNQA